MGAKKKAQQTACLNNGKQIGTGINVYADDWDNRLPNCTSYGPRWDGGRGRYIPDLCARYINVNKKSDIFRCPAFTAKDRFWSGTLTLDSNKGFGYYWNHMYWDNRYNDYGRKKGPSSDYDVISGKSRAECRQWTKAQVLWCIPYWGSGNGPDCARHNGGITCVCADGHAKWTHLEPGRDYWYDHSADGWNPLAARK